MSDNQFPLRSSALGKHMILQLHVVVSEENLLLLDVLPLL